tara:strand:+ start:15618 stop:16730 length:1113 start_codon:yes stop_codon:yes gene_type:complete
MEEENDLNMDMFMEIDGADEIFGESEEIELEENNTPSGDDQDEDLNEDPEKVVLDNEDPDDGIDADEELDDEDESSSSNPNLFKSLSQLLQEKGLISSEDLNVTDEDSFVDLFKKEIEKNEYSDITELQKEYLLKLRDGIPHEKAIKDITQTDQLGQVTNELLEQDADLRQRVIYQDFINRGYSEEKATKLVQRSLELDVDLEDAQDAMSSIREFSKARMDRENEELKNQKLAQEKTREDNIKKITKEIESIKEIIPGYEVSENVKNKIKDNMFKVIGENPDNNMPENSLMKYQRENPIEFDKKLYYLFTITNGFNNFDSIKQETQSRALQDLEKAYKSTTKINDPGSPAYLQDPESYLIDLKGDEIVVD